MTKLSKRTLTSVGTWYRRAYGLQARPIDSSGAIAGGAAISPIDRPAVIGRARRHALQEAVRWGEPYSFFLAPGVLSWVVPVVDGYTVCGGLLGGEVLGHDDAEERGEAVEHLVRSGVAREEAQRYLARLPVWPPGRCREAADRLADMLYRVSGLAPHLLAENRERYQQQRQIAEEIHRRKHSADRGLAADDERKLLALIRVGDHKGARRILNQLLGSMFFRSANLTVIRAFMIEMMGYLVRRAVEDSAYLEPIMEQNHRWTAKILEADTFESLAAGLRMALDDFMRNIYEMGYAETDPRIERAMSYLAANYNMHVRVEDVAAAAQVSPVRLAHIIKEKTGKSVIAHVHAYRLQEARRLLEETDDSCAEIAVRVGFGDQSYFTKQFRVQVGVTPARYRRRLRHPQRHDSSFLSISR